MRKSIINTPLRGHNNKRVGYVFCMNIFFFLPPVAPTIRVRQAEVNATADIGHSAMLACDADGFPEPTITWTR